MNIRIIQYKSDLKKDGTAPLYLQIRQGRKQTRIPLEVSVEPEFFDSSRQKISPKHKQSKEINLLIDNVLSKCTKIQTDYYLKGIALDPLKLREELTNEVSRYSFIKYWIQTSEKQLERGIIQKSTFNR